MAPYSFGDRDDKSRYTTRVCVVLTVLVFFWNIYLQVQLSGQSNQIQGLYKLHLKLKADLLDTSSDRVQLHRHRRAVELESDIDDVDNDMGDDDEEEEEDDDDDNGEVNGVTDSEEVPVTGEKTQTESAEIKDVSNMLLARFRHKRDATRKSTRNRNKKKKGSGGGATAAHFVAYVDEERIAREIAEGRQPDMGTFSGGGSLVPNDQIYRFWKPEAWTKPSLFNYSMETGKVKVTKRGLYMIYAQVVFHGPSARKSYGIHVNDPLVPKVESLAFDNINTRHRNKRTLSASTENGTSPTSPPERHRRGSEGQYSSYSQCNTLAIMKLKAGDEVFVRSMEPGRSIIPKSYLTFWGMVRL